MISEAINIKVDSQHRYKGYMNYKNALKLIENH